MNELIEFFSFKDANIRYVTTGCVLMAASSGIVGTFSFLKKKALIGDAVAHAILPGICIAFLFSGQKDPIILIIGAFFFGLLALLAIDFIAENSKLTKDTAIALVLSVMFGFGILLLTMIQKTGNAAQTGLDQFLFGKAAAMVGKDLWVFSSLSVLLIAVVVILYKEFRIITFDPDYARILGFPVKWLDTILTTLTVMAIVTGIQAVGVVLMAAMLITPAAASRFWTNGLTSMIILSGVLGAVSGFSGAFISYTAPGMPTGPWIVMVISFLALASFLFAPKKGIFYRRARLITIRKKIMNENILKLFYQLGENDEHFFAPRTIQSLVNRRPMDDDMVKKGLKSLVKQGFLVLNADGYLLTDAGKRKGQRTLRLHRLWELYLTRYVEIAEDHVHEDAETIEHLITPELEKRLEKLMEFPEKDPHQSKIPYS